MKPYIASALGMVVLLLSQRGRAADCAFDVEWESKTKVKLTTGDLVAAAVVADGSDCTPSVQGTKLALDAACIAGRILGEKDPTLGTELRLKVQNPDRLPPTLKDCPVKDAAVVLRAKVATIVGATKLDGQTAKLAPTARVDAWTARFDGTAWKDLPTEAIKKEASLLEKPPWVLVAGGKEAALLDIGAASSCQVTPTVDPKSGALLVPMQALAQLDPLTGEAAAAQCNPTFDGGAVRFETKCLAPKLVASGDKSTRITVGTVKTGGTPPAGRGGCLAQDRSLTVELLLGTEEIALKEQNNDLLLRDRAAVTKQWPRIWVNDAWVELDKQPTASAIGKGVLARTTDGKLGILVKKEDEPVLGGARPSDCSVPSVSVRKDRFTVRNEHGVNISVPREVKTIAWCPDAPGSALLCIDLACGGPDLLLSPDRNVLQPNRGVVVRIRHLADQEVGVTLGGERGLVELGMKGGKGVGIERQGNEVSSGVEVSSFGFAPRLPGAADFTISVQRTPERKQIRKLELQVESLSWGAARFGFGALFGDVVANTYEAQTFAGSAQQEIALTKDPSMGWEAVVALAPYLLDVLTCPGRGRSHTGGCNRYLAPYLGIGIVGQGPTGVSSFNSFYLGAEVEFAPSFSVAAAAVWRAVDTLRHGYAEGSPIEAGTGFTRSTTAFGFGLVLNVSPGFLEFATGTSGKSGAAPPASDDSSTEGGTQ